MGYIDMAENKTEDSIISGAYIEITNRCNLNCRDCYNASGLNCTTCEISPSDLEKFITMLYEGCGANSFTISGGEPTMHTRWNEVCDMIERLNHLKFTVITNGTTGNKRLKELLENNGHVTVQYSIDGTCAEIHDQMRGKGKFDITMKNVTSMKPKVKPYFHMVVAPFNRDNVKEYFDFADMHHATPTFSFTSKHGNASDNWEEVSMDDSQRLETLSIIIDEYKKRKIENIPAPFCTVKCALTDTKNKFNLCVTPYGDIYPCQGLYDKKFSLGILHDFNLSAIIKKAEMMRQTLIERTAMDYGCKRCLVRSVCGKGCAASAYTLCGDIMGYDGDCTYRRKVLIKYYLMPSAKDTL